METNQRANLIVVWVSGALFAIALALSPFGRGHFGNETLVFTAMFSALLAWLAWGVAGGLSERLVVSVSPLLIAVALFCLWVILSAALSAAPSVSIPATSPLCAFGIVFLAMLCQRDQNSAWMGAICAALIVATGWAFLAIYQYFVLGVLPVAFFAQPNAWAGFASITLFGALALLLESVPRSRAMLVLLWIVIALVAASIGLSGSRGAFIATVVGCAFLVFSGLRTGTTGKSAALVAVVLVVIVTSGQTAALLAPHSTGTDHGRGSLSAQLDKSDPTLKSWTFQPEGSPLPRSSPLLGRLSQVFDREATLKYRLVIWIPALEMAKAAPWHGQAPGVFWLLYPRSEERRGGKEC